MPVLHSHLLLSVDIVKCFYLFATYGALSIISGRYVAMLFDKYVVIVIQHLTFKSCTVCPWCSCLLFQAIYALF